MSRKWRHYCELCTTMNKEYLDKVVIFLQQELPQFKADISLIGNTIEFQVAEGQIFQTYYDKVHQAVGLSINRIRNRDFDLDFTVKSKNQERDFKIYKLKSI